MPVLALTLTGLGWAAVPLVVVAVAAVVVAVVLWKRRSRVAGFDLGEASSYVWQNLPRDCKRRVAMSDVVAVLEAERDLDEPMLDDDAALVATLCVVVGEREGVSLEPEDVAQMLVVQYRYAEEKGLL